MMSVKGNLVPTGFGGGDTEVFGSKTYKTIRPEVANFDKLDIAGNFDLTLVPGNTFLEIEGEENILDLLDIQVYPNPSGQLEIKAKEGYILRPSELIKLKIGFETLKSIHLVNEVKVAATGPLTFDKINIIAYNESSIQLDLTANKVELQLQNAATADLSGRVQKSTVSTYNYGKLDGSKLKIQDATIQSYNSSSVKVDVAQKLSIQSYNNSRVNYTGNPVNLEKRASNYSNIKEIK